MRRKQEEYAKAGTAVELVVLPKSSDVLFGKGRSTQEHIGNMRLKSLVDDLLQRYDELNKHEKTDLAAEVVESVKKSSGRFLTQESGVWIKVHDDFARQKVAQLFRNRRKVYVASEKKVEAKQKSARGEPDGDSPPLTTSAKRLKSG